jgi:hypothetical protein
MFTDSLEMALTLSVDGKPFAVPGGNIKTLKLDHKSYGFSCLLSFWVSNQEGPDLLFPFFMKQDLMEVKLSVLKRLSDEEGTAEPLILQGLVKEKRILTETVIENVKVKGDPVFYRRYEIFFADAAFVLWRQHYPNDLMTAEKSIKNLLDAHKGEKVTLKYDWDIIDDTFAVTTLPLGTENNKDVSFYDFVCWYVSSLNGVFTYDSQKDTYTISKTKKEAVLPISMKKRDVHDIRIEFPETIRHNTNLLNAYSENPEHNLLKQKQSVDGVVHEYLVRLPIASDFKALGSQETEKLKIREHELYVTFGRCPLVPCRPGRQVILEVETWSKKIFPYGKIYRARNMMLDAGAVDDGPDVDHNVSHAKYNIDLTTQLELKDETWVSLPSFNNPVFPLYVEGKIVSEQGKEEEETFQIYQDKDTSVDQYKVSIPLWDNQNVVIPFEPNFFSGHFYFPAYKNARVLVALDFHSARIERFLDWRPGARLPMDTQGNRILVGKTGKSQTSITHVYEEDKPVLKVKRILDKDTETITMTEGSLILETKEEDN